MRFGYILEYKEYAGVIIPKKKSTAHPHCASVSPFSALQMLNAHFTVIAIFSFALPSPVWTTCDTLTQKKKVQIIVHIFKRKCRAVGSYNRRAFYLIFWLNG